MTLTIDLTPEQEAVLQQAVVAPKEPAQTVLHNVVMTLPNGQEVSVEIKARHSSPERPRKTPVEIVAGWKASGLPSVYARDPEDATVIARRLRAEAERRGWAPR